MNNLRRFNTEEEYSSTTLSYPAVSWIVSGDTVKYDKEAPVEVNDKLMFAFTSAEGSAGSGRDIVIYNCGSSDVEQSVTSITVNDVAIQDFSNCTLSNYTESDTVYVVKYGLEGTTIGDWFSGDLGGGNSSSPQPIDVLIPANVTNIEFLPDNINNLVFQSSTVQNMSYDSSSFMGEGIYVPDDAVNTYKESVEWGNRTALIHPISDYSGNLPV